MLPLLRLLPTILPLLLLPLPLPLPSTRRTREAKISPGW
jgi:hypothetical protein